MGFLDSLLIKLFTKELTEIESKNGDVLIKFPGKYKVKKGKEIVQIFDPKDEHFLLQFSVLNDKTDNEFDIESEYLNEKKINPNAEIQSTGKYDCICSATRTEDNKEIIYNWKIGHLKKRILATLLINDLNDRKEIDKRVYLAGEFLKGIEIKNALQHDI